MVVGRSLDFFDALLAQPPLTVEIVFDESS